MTTVTKNTLHSDNFQFRDAVILTRWDDEADIDTRGKVYVGITRICVMHEYSARYQAPTHYQSKYSVEVWYDKGEVVHPQRQWLQKCLTGRLQCCIDADRPPYAGETRWTNEQQTEFEMYCGEATGWVIHPTQDFVDKIAKASVA